MTEPADDAPRARAADPDAPREVKLPSGLTVTLRSHRDLRRRDIHRVYGAVTGDGPSRIEMYDALIELLVTASSDQRHPVPFTADVLEALDPDDYLALWGEIQDAYNLVTGRSVLPRVDDHADPTPPTTESNDSDPG